MIVLINGPHGSGKTSVSEKLVAHFERAVMLDGDTIGAVHPFDVHDVGQVSYLYQTMVQLVAWHQAHNTLDFVINYVFETPESLTQLRGQLDELDHVTYAFRLTCAEDEIARRMRWRDSDDPDGELNCFRAVTAMLEAGAQRGDMGFEIDTTRQTAGQVAQAIWDNIHEEVEIVPYDPAWPAAFAAERDAVQVALDGLTLAVHHIGSTAVPELAAKPVIDIMVVLRDLDDAVLCIAPLRALGYSFVDHPQNTERRFFRKGCPRSHHLHLVAQGSTALRDHLLFRDALRADPEKRLAYQSLKQALATAHRADRATYSEQKSAFVAAVLRR